MVDCKHMAVQFEEPEFQRVDQMNAGQRGGQGAVTALIMKLGLAKTAAQANIVMLVIAAIAIGLTIYLLFPSSAVVPPPSMTNPLVQDAFR